MSKGLLIALLAALPAGIAPLVWWQSQNYAKREQHLRRQLEEERQLRLRNRPFVPRATSGEPTGDAALMEAFL